MLLPPSMSLPAQDSGAPPGQVGGATPTRSAWKRLTSAVALLALAVGPRAARGDFEPRTGKVVRGDAAWAQGFEEDPAGALLLYDSRFMPIPAERLAEHLRLDPAEAIEGQRALELGGEVPFGYLRINTASVAGRRIELRLWQKPRGTRVMFSLQWYSGEGEQTAMILAELPFQPTGRATDDGWEEWSSGPVDAALGGALPAFYLQIYDEQMPTARQGLSGYDFAALALIDGLELIDLGPAAVPSAACTLPVEQATCGLEGSCLYGRCVDAAASLGPWLENPALRADYLARRAFEFSTFEGGREPRRHTAAAAQLFQAMTTAPSRARYWELYTEAIDLLGDGHASVAVAAYTERLSAGVCLYQSVADLLPGGGNAPMVFDASPRNPIGQRLAPGDVLTEIDGATVPAWMAAAGRYLDYSGDPAGRLVNVTPMVFEAALRTGATLRFSRCAVTSSVSTSSAAPRACRPEEVELIDVDLAEASAGVWANDPPRWKNDVAICDFRLKRPVESGSRGREYDYAGYRDLEGVRAIQINGVPEPTQSPAWEQAIEAALGPGPAQVLFDQRQGLGGSVGAVDLIGGYLLAPSDAWGAEFIPALETLSPALRAGLRSCAAQPGAIDGASCAMYFPWALGEAHPGRSAAAHAKLAVLNGRDVSGNDYTSQLFSLRRSSETRIFGPGPTYGAFGVIWSLPAYGGEAIGGSFQVHDTVFLSSADDPSEDFRTTHGVVPDEVVLQTQSDAVRGIDTTIEAALRWLNP